MLEESLKATIMVQGGWKGIGNTRMIFIFDPYIPTGLFRDSLLATNCQTLQDTNWDHALFAACWDKWRFVNHTG